MTFLPFTVLTAIQILRTACAWRYDCYVRDDPNRKIYSDKLVSHVSPGSRSRFDSYYHKMLRLFKRNQSPSTPVDTTLKFMQEDPASPSDSLSPLPAECVGFRGATMQH